jgi:hypothetical protein
MENDNYTVTKAQAAVLSWLSFWESELAQRLVTISNPYFPAKGMKLPENSCPWD